MGYISAITFSFSWQAEFLRPTLQAKHILCDSRGDSLYDSHFVWPTYLTTGRTERRGKNPKTISTRSADYISNLPDWIFNPLLVSIRDTGIFIDSGTQFNLLSERWGCQNHPIGLPLAMAEPLHSSVWRERRLSAGPDTESVSNAKSLHMEHSLITHRQPPLRPCHLPTGSALLKVTELREKLHKPAAER